MSAIKNYYHNEICKEQEDAMLDEEFYYNLADARSDEELEDEQIVARAEEMEEDLFNSELPRWMFS